MRSLAMGQSSVDSGTACHSYSVKDNSDTNGFMKSASSMVLDMNSDERGNGARLVTRWDRKKMRFIKVRQGEDPNDPRARKLRALGGSKSAKKNVYGVFCISAYLYLLLSLTTHARALSLSLALSLLLLLCFDFVGAIV
jgi:steroid 5-alpha reductase family enzyme